MGYMGPFDMLVAVGALEMALGHFGYGFEPGAGVAAVQTTIARGV
jgi:aspartate aminotransferase-like enzyme